MTKPKQVKVPMGQRKSGLAVPPEAVDICKHMEIVKRIKPSFTRYLCDGCGERVFLVPITMKLLTQSEFDQLQMAQVKMGRAAERKQKTGLVLPDDVRREQQEGQKR